MFFRFQGWLPPIDVNSYPIKYRSSTYTNTNSNVCPEAVLLQFKMYLLFYVSKHFLWFVVFFQHRQQWPESDSTGLGDGLHQQVMLWTRCYIAYNMGRISRVKTQEIWQLEDFFLQVLAVHCASAARESERFRKVLFVFEIMVILFENVCFMDDEKIPSVLGNLFQISHSREVSSWPLAVCSQCGLGGEVWGLFCIWLKLTGADFWRIIIDAIDVTQGGDRAGQLCLRLWLQSKATNPTFGGRIWMLLQTTQTHYISGELNVLRKK